MGVCIIRYMYMYMYVLSDTCTCTCMYALTCCFSLKLNLIDRSTELSMYDNMSNIMSLFILLGL